jgi:Family of unknown function (DUF6677)
MAKTDTSPTSARTAATPAPLTAMAVLAPAIGWLIPGAGHLIQKRWIRGIILMICVVTMFVLGLAMDGKIYKPNTGDLLDILGFVGDLGAGGLYIAGRMGDWGRAVITQATADYGTKYIVVAGLLNVMSMVDAYHIAIGKKQ